MKKRLLGLILAVLMMFPFGMNTSGAETPASTSGKKISVDMQRKRPLDFLDEGLAGRA